MKFLRTYAFLFFLTQFSWSLPALNTPSAKFTFNNKSSRDEISGQKAKLEGASYTEDRFGNAYSAVYLFGNEYSYINLGSYGALKPKEGSVSLWIKIEEIVYSGKGARVTPILLTKCADRDDFFEAYGIYYVPGSRRVAAGCSRDSVKQCAVYSTDEFKLYTWHHLVFTYSDLDIYFYVDGKQEGKMPKNFRTEFNPLDSVMLGNSANKKNNRFANGVFDDIEVYDRVLTPAEVEELYNAPNPNKNKIILNWVLLALAILAGIVIIYLFVKHRLSLTLLKEKERLELANKLLENDLRINRALMNPHFIFNSLNTLHNYILKNNPEKASDYLVRFSKLIRRILDSNMSDTISLEMEIELIRGYLEIESMRFKEHIHYSIVLGEHLVPSSVTIPIMMIQPFIENAVWHGLLDKAGEKQITISFSLQGTQYLKCIIEDNGTGLKEKDNKLTDKKSLATAFIKHRLDLLNRIHQLNAFMDILYKPGTQGTVVTILLPVLNK